MTAKIEQICHHQAEMKKTQKLPNALHTFEYKHDVIGRNIHFLTKKIPLHIKTQEKLKRTQKSLEIKSIFFKPPK